MVASEGCMCKFVRMSRCTRGTAVAVRASMGMEDSMGWVRREEPILRNSGRKSKQTHFPLPCRCILANLSKKFPPTNFSGVTYTKRNSPLNALSSMEASV
eukprot:CCRYP_019758-RC/>CCRYP_019758-RC protein AED:0.48 eAED:1.00 QI:0/0/0/1/0/0/2/0/99